MDASDPSRDTHSYLEVNYDVETLGKLPMSVKRRVRALKKLQMKTLEIEVEFFKRLQDLEIQFSRTFNDINVKRRAIVCGEVEPTDEECNAPLVHGLAADELENLNASSPPEPVPPTKGIPNFWLQLLKNNEKFCGLIQEKDEPVLEHLIDISYELGSNPYTMTISFEFKENPYFENKVLTKTYLLDLGLNSAELFSYAGPSAKSVEGTEIVWKKEKQTIFCNVQGKVQKHASIGDTFFNFFRALKSEDFVIDDMEEYHDLLCEDYEISQLIREEIVSRAVVYFTGEQRDDLMDEMDEMDEDEDEEGSDDDETDD